MASIALAMFLMSNPLILSHDVRQCEKTYKISESETFYGCETCMETDSGACVYMEATCYRVTSSKNGNITDAIDCAPHTCGDVPRSCSLLYSGIEELQSIEGQIVNCSDKTIQICTMQKWVVQPR
jgi:hypothetical protein